MDEADDEAVDEVDDGVVGEADDKVGDEADDVDGAEVRTVEPTAWAVVSAALLLLAVVSAALLLLFSSRLPPDLDNKSSSALLKAINLVIVNRNIIYFLCHKTVAYTNIMRTERPYIMLILKSRKCNAYSKHISVSVALSSLVS